jgi:hypothetical protein
MGPGLTPAPGPLRSEEPGAPHEAQHPLAAHAHVVFPAQASAHLAVALYGYAEEEA